MTNPSSYALDPIPSLWKGVSIVILSFLIFILSLSPNSSYTWLSFPILKKSFIWFFKLWLYIFLFFHSQTHRNNHLHPLPPLPFLSLSSHICILTQLNCPHLQDYFFIAKPNCFFLVLILLDLSVALDTVYQPLPPNSYSFLSPFPYSLLSSFCDIALS